MRDRRPVRAVMGLLMMLALAASAGCENGAAKWLAGQRNRPQPVLTWQDVDPAALIVNNDAALHAVRFSIHLPAASAPPAALELVFQDRLDGAKVDASATGPHHTIALLQHKRFAADTVALSLAPLPLTDVEVIVHNHLRPPPVIRQVRVGRPIAATASSAVASGGQP